MRQNSNTNMHAQPVNQVQVTCHWRWKPNAALLGPCTRRIGTPVGATLRIGRDNVGLIPTVGAAVADAVMAGRPMAGQWVTG